MAKSTPIQTNFTGGEISPRLHGRVDLAKYGSALERCENFIIFPHGGMTKRPGTRFIASTKVTTTVKLIPFIFSTTQSYMLEFGNLYVRFYRNEGQLTSGGSAYEIATPYTTADLDGLDFTQSADILYLVHKSYPIKQLNRVGATNWTLTDFAFKDGPYESVNTSATTVTAAATTGTTTVTASTGIFASTDVGRWIRIMHAATDLGAAKITAYTSSTVVTVAVDADFPFHATTATTQWRLGSWSNTTGWPSAVSFFQERLFFSGSTQKPSTIWGSRSGDFLSFSPTNADGEVLDDSALNFTLSTDQVNAIRWIYGEKRLQIGTSDGPFILSSGRNFEALTPTNVTVSRETTDGSADERVVGASRTTLYIDRSRLKVRELAYDVNAEGYTSPDMTLLAEHITTGYIKQIAYARSPDNLVWVLLQTGELRCLTYEREQEVVAWHRHIIGGTNTFVESIGVIPKNDESSEILYMVVRRTINGATVKYVEYLERSFDTAKGDTLEQAHFVDSGLSYSGTATSTLTGLSHLEGQVVQVFVNGAVHPNRTVTSGQITLDRPATTAAVGLGYVAKARTLDPEVQTENGPSQGKIRRIERVTFRVVDTFNLKFGVSESNLEIIPFREAGSAMGSVELFSGDKRVLLQHTPTREFTLTIQSDTPHPATILMIMYAMVVSDR
jgi:hypothetical protein